MRRPARPSKRRAKRHRHLSLSARDSEWAVVSRNAAKLGLSKARYLVGLVERDAAEEEDRGPWVALAPEEQRGLLETVRAIHALMQDAPGDEAAAREAPAREPDRPAAEPDPATDVERSPPGVTAPPAPEAGGAAGPPEPESPEPRQPRLL